MELRKVRQGGGRSGVEAGVAKALGHGITRREEEIGSGWAPAVARTGAPAGNTSLAEWAGEQGAPEKEPTVEAEVGMVGRRAEQLSPPPSAISTFAMEDPERRRGKLTGKTREGSSQWLGKRGREWHHGPLDGHRADHSFFAIVAALSSHGAVHK